MDKNVWKNLYTHSQENKMTYIPTAKLTNRFFLDVRNSFYE